MTLEDYETEFSIFDVPAKETFRLIVGYKLVPLKMQHGRETWKNLVLNSGDVDIDQFLLNSASKDVFCRIYCFLTKSSTSGAMLGLYSLSA